jgi:hypothetical protein
VPRTFPRKRRFPGKRGLAVGSLAGVTGDTASIDAEWQESYDGEVLGESYFRALGAGTDDAGRRAKSGVLAELEHRTRLAMVATMEARGLPIEEKADVAELGRAFGADAAGRPWRDVMSDIATVAGPFLGIYRHLRDVATGDGERRTAQLLVDHEEALIEFTRLEREGAGDTSLKAVKALPHMG